MIETILQFLQRSAFMRQVGGFLAVGATNTVISLLVYEGFILILHYAWAYVISFLVAVIYSAFANGKYVFRSSINLQKMALYFLVCLFNMLVGLWVLHVLIASFGVRPALAPLFVIAIMLPSNFFLSRFALTRPPTPRD